METTTKSSDPFVQLGVYLAMTWPIGTRQGANDSAAVHAMLGGTYNPMDYAETVAHP